VSGIYDIELMTSKKIKGSNGNYVFHSKSLPTVSYTREASPGSSYNPARWHTGNHPFLVRDWSFLSGLDVPTGLPLNREKFLSTGQFNVLIFLLELRETIQMLRSAFHEQITYGGFTWGYMPFVAELKALMKSLINLQVLDLQNQRQPYEDTLSIILDHSTTSKLVRGTLTYHLSGFLDFSGTDSILQIYDALGFHPDIQTAWDLIPLSFLADAFLPIGDVIDELNTQGWVTHALFSGWSSQKFFGEYAYPGGKLSTNGHPISVFERNYSVNQLAETYAPPVLLQAELPSIRDIFNFVYISKAFTDRDFIVSRLSPKQRKLLRSHVEEFTEAWGHLYILGDIWNAFESQT
jgi:hypothetical protein